MRAEIRPVLTKGPKMKRLYAAAALLFAFFLLCAGCGKISYEWVKYKDDPDGNAFFYKLGDVKKEGLNHLVQVWGKEVYSSKGREAELRMRAKDGLKNTGYDQLAYKKCLYEIDCRKQKISILAIRHYGTDEKELYSDESQVRRWLDIELGSTGDDLQKAVCR